MNSKSNDNVRNDKGKRRDRYKLEKNQKKINCTDQKMTIKILFKLPLKF